MTSSTTLIVSNDFPPRVGGIETFVRTLVDLLDGDVVVLTSRAPGHTQHESNHDAALPFPVHRMRYPLVPTPPVGRRAESLLRRHGVTRVLFGAAAPLGLLAGRLRSAGAERIVALTHGHETWWARSPGTRALLRRIAADVDVVTTIADHTEQIIGRALTGVGTPLIRLAPPVDLDLFHPGPPSQGPPRVIAPGRLVARKGVEVLVRAWPGVLARVPDAQLWVVGDGPRRPRLERLARSLGVTGVRFLGNRPHSELPQLFAGAHVCALPVHDRWFGLDSEGLGIVFLEAAATGLPVIVGDSGGAPETVLPGRSGAVLPAFDVNAWTDALVGLLRNPERAAAWGRVGRDHVRRHFGTQAARQTLRRALHLP